ncbi:hypothetical protein Btru_040622 [Bulinus truncatus]|nr:hypothetical protein Btru_040622 [Bulinus truncatus]
MAADGSSSSTMESAEKTEAIKKAADLLAQGKRHMVCGEVPKAVNLFEEAVQILVKECGELSRDCADAYFSCGSALLELGRMETNVLGTALEGVEVEEEKEEEENEQFEKPPADDDSVRQQLREEVYEAMAEGDREKELSKPVSENKKSDGGDSCVETSEKVTEGENTTNQDDIVSTKKPDQEQDSVADTGDANKDKTSKKNEEIESGEIKVHVPEEKTEGDIVKNDEKVINEQPSVSDSDVNEKAIAENTEKDVKETNLKENSEDVTEKVEKINESEKETVNESGKDLEVLPQLSAEKESAPENAAANAEAIKIDDENKDVEMADESEEPEADDDEAEETVDEETAEGDNATEDGEKEEDVPNFQLAWEYLDLAKVIYLKSESKDDQLKAAECHLKLGEVSMETEQHTTAVEDLLSALKIQQKLLEPEDRLIAETHYQLGLAYGLGKEFKLSIEQYQLAISVIESKIASLKKLTTEQDVDTENKENLETNQELKKYLDEIKELQDLIPEMRNKIEDTQIEENDLQKLKAIVMEDICQSGTTKGFGSPSKKSDVIISGEVDENGEKKTSDIAHLVRKKRKPEDDAVAPAEQEVKKIKQETSEENGPKVNGDSDINGISDTPSEKSSEMVNGDSEKSAIDKDCKEKIQTESAAEVEPMAT